MKTFNKRGDRGETSLLYGQRRPKSDPQCEAYGTIDEAVSALGLARTLSQKEKVQGILFGVQQDLFIVAAELATPTQRYPDFAQKREVVNEKMVKRLEEMIEALEEELEMPQAFIIPGACVGSAALDLARTIIRRAERRVVSLKDAGLIPNEEVLKYLNRLADLVFTLARYEEAESGR